jgi:hypothetical protein
MPEPVKAAAPSTPPVAVDPKAPPTAAPVAPAAPQTYKIEHGGKTYELTAEQIASLQGRASQFDETSRKKAELEQGISNLMTELENNPFDLLKKRGKDVNKLITDAFKQIVEREAQDPKERELAELRAERTARQKQDEDTKKSAEAETRKKEMQVVQTRLLTEIDKELTAKGMPKDIITIDRVLRLVAAGRRVKGKEFTIGQAVDIFQREDMKHLGFIAKQLPSERLQEMFGKDFIKKLNGEQVALLKKADAEVRKDNKEAAAAPASHKKVTETERRRIQNEVAGA